MRIARLRIRDFRCFHGTCNASGWNLDFRPLDSLNLLIGSNGVGKSTMLDAIDLVLNPDHRNNPSLISEYDFPCCDYKSKAINIELTVKDLGEQETRFRDDVEWFQRDTQEAVADGDTPDEATHFRGVRILFAARVDGVSGEIVWQWLLPKLHETSLEEPKELSASQQRAISYVRIAPTIGPGAFTLSRNSPLGRQLRRVCASCSEAPSTVGWSPLAGVQEELRKLRGETTLNLGNTDLVTSGDDTSATVVDQGVASVADLKAHLYEMVSEAGRTLGDDKWKGREPALGSRFGDVYSELYATSLGLRMPTEAQALGFIPFHRLSTGERYALSLALATKRVHGVSSPIVVAEDPETALYPAAVGHVISGISQAEGGPQVLITSHSEAVLRHCGLRSVLLLTTDRQIKRAQDLMLASGQPQYTTSEVFSFECMTMPGAASALFCDKILLVEGACDALVSGALYRLANECNSVRQRDAASAAHLGWTVLSVDGAGKIDSYASALRRMGKMVAILLDGDRAGEQAAKKVEGDFPTFRYERCAEEASPVLEDALFIGLTPAQRANALTTFHSHPTCASCAEREGKCWKLGKCAHGKRFHKRDFQNACLQEWGCEPQLPPVFQHLAQLLDTRQPGETHFVSIEADEPGAEG